jgi:hypothetical protein
VKPDEKYALETLVEKYGGKYIKGDEPPDGYLPESVKPAPTLSLSPPASTF